jgi:formate hydrogenlyase transcriptional activator
MTLEDATRDHIVQTLEETKWVVGGKYGAAARLGIARTTLLSKMRRLGLELAANEMRGTSHQGAFASVA